MNAQDTLQRTLADIAARDGEWKAFVSVHDAAAAQRELARALGAGGPLQGLPVGVKDIFDTASLPAHYGSPLFAGHQPRVDAAIVQAIRAAGGVLVGKTTTTEFAFLNPTATLNPNAPGRTPGGSSAGSAAAVAAHMLPLAVGTQTGGSVIRPASYCGVVGFKPTYAALPTPGLKPFSWSLDTVGFFTRSVDEMARWSSAISGRPWATSAAKPVFGVASHYPFGELTPSARKALDHARQRLQAQGATVKQVELPTWVADVFKAHDAVQGWEAARALRDEFELHADQLSPVLRDYLREAGKVDARAYDAGQAVAQDARARLHELFDGIDVLLAPSAPDEPPAGLGSTGASTFNRAWTLLHGPCLSVPGATGVNGFPMGVQVIAPVGADALCLAAGRILEAAFASS